MKVSVIATLGTSPPVVTEFIQYLEKEERVSDLTLIVTGEKMIQEGAKLLEAAIKSRYPHIHVHIKNLPFNDIITDEDNIKFMGICADILREQRERYNADKIYVCLAGGRKEMGTSLAMLGQILDVDAVYHVVAPNIKSMSVDLERARHDISELAASPDPMEYYTRKRELFDALMYPPPSTYNVIRIPVIPYPKEVLYQIASLLSANVIERSKVRISPDLMKRLSTAGLIKLTREKVYVLDAGRAFYQQILRKEGF
ncbi:MAG: CRISPR-associated protein Csx14 [Nitrososphaerota archaeon]